MSDDNRIEDVSTLLPTPKDGPTNKQCLKMLAIIGEEDSNSLSAWAAGYIQSLESKLNASNERVRHYITKTDALTKQTAIYREFVDAAEAMVRDDFEAHIRYDEALAALPKGEKK